MEKQNLFDNTEKGKYQIEETQILENNTNDIGAPPLVIVVQGGKNVILRFLFSI